MHNVYDRMHGDFPAKNTVYTPYILKNVWFWPTLVMCHVCKYSAGVVKDEYAH